jgi:hypothetical protein
MVTEWNGKQEGDGGAGEVARRRDLDLNGLAGVEPMQGEFRERPEIDGLAEAQVDRGGDAHAGRAGRGMAAGQLEARSGERPAREEE